jgi:DNA-binding NtrC family response regulator
MGDIPLLARHLLRRASVTTHRSVPVLSDEALAALTSYEWPGNVRELENTLTRALVVARGDVIRAEHIELGPVRGADNGEVLTLAEVERSHVERALARAGGSKTDAARLLGVSRPRLDRLLKKYALQ